LKFRFFGLFLLLLAGIMVGQEEDVQLEAVNQRWVEDLYWEGSGNVKIRYGSIRIEADWVGLDWLNKTVEAEGKITLRQGRDTITSRRMTYNLEEVSGIFEEAEGSFGDMYQFKGKRIIREDETHYVLEEGLFTSCDLEHPPWSFTIHRASVEMDGYAYLSGIAFRVHRLPLLYFPYLVWPVKQDRARGLLTPHFGYTAKRGAYLGLAYFLPMGDSFDLTFMGDYYSEGYSGGGIRFRYAPTVDLKGEAQAYTIRDTEGTDWWKFNLVHTQTALPLNFRLDANIELLSDIDFFREFERTFDRNTTRSIYSHVTLSKNWGLNSFILRADHRETAFSGSSIEKVTQEQYPKIEYRMRQRPLLRGALPLYLSMESRYNLFKVDKGENYRGTYGRLDVLPTLSTSFARLPWLSIRPSASLRATYYSRTPDETGSLEGDSYTRTYQLFQADLVGPSFSKIFNGSSFQLKHLIEPRINYQNLVNLEDQKVPVFDENDSIQSKHQIRYALVNRIFLKKGESTATEIASFEISQRHSFNENQPLTSLTVDGERETSQKSALDLSLRFYPGKSFNLDTRTSFHAITHKWESLQLSGGTRVGMHYANLIYFRTNPQVEGGTKQHQIRLYSGFKPHRTLDVQAQVNYDLENNYPPQQRYIMRYTGSCYAISLEYRDYRLGTSQDREYKFTFDLKNVGSFLEITGGVDELFGSTP